MKIRHILLLLLALSAIAFMQPLVSLLGGLTLLLGVGALIYRDLTPAAQDALERRVLGWLRRTRTGSVAEHSSSPLSRRQLPATSSEAGMPAERVRRSRIKVARRTDPAASAPPRTPDPTDGPPAA